MAKRRTTKRATCQVCEDSVAAMRMSVHLQSHIPRVGEHTCYVIRAGDREAFWAFMQVPGDCTLKDVDQYLRDEWLDWDHLSMFKISGVTYDSYVEGMRDANSMDYKIRNLLKAKMNFYYEYDFGSPTALWLTTAAGPVPPLISEDGIVTLAAQGSVDLFW